MKEKTRMKQKYKALKKLKKFKIFHKKAKGLNF